MRSSCRVVMARRWATRDLQEGVQEPTAGRVVVDGAERIRVGARCGVAEGVRVQGGSIWADVSAQVGHVGVDGGVPARVGARHVGSVATLETRSPPIDRGWGEGVSRTRPSRGSARLPRGGNQGRCEATSGGRDSPVTRVTYWPLGLTGRPSAEGVAAHGAVADGDFGAIIAGDPQVPAFVGELTGPGLGVVVWAEVAEGVAPHGVRVAPLADSPTYRWRPSLPAEARRGSTTVPRSRRIGDPLHTPGGGKRRRSWCGSGR